MSELFRNYAIEHELVLARKGVKMIVAYLGDGSLKKTPLKPAGIRKDRKNPYKGYSWDLPGASGGHIVLRYFSQRNPKVDWMGAIPECFPNDWEEKRLFVGEIHHQGFRGQVACFAAEDPRTVAHKLSDYVDNGLSAPAPLRSRWEVMVDLLIDKLGRKTTLWFAQVVSSSSYHLDETDGCRVMRNNPEHFPSRPKAVEFDLYKLYSGFSSYRHDFIRMAQSLYTDLKERLAEFEPDYWFPADT